MCFFSTCICMLVNVHTLATYIITQSLNGLNQTFQLINFKALYNACDRLLICYTICWSWSMEHKSQSSTAFSAVQQNFSLHKMAIQIHFHIVHFWVQHMLKVNICQHFAPNGYSFYWLRHYWCADAHCTIDQGKANQRLTICATWFHWSGH